MKKTIGSVNPQFRFMGIFREAPPLHFYVIQFITFAYIIYRFTSRDYTIYGYVPAEGFNYPFNFRLELFPVAPGYILTFQFIYDLFGLSRTQPMLETLQYIIIGSSFLGIAGIFPRICSIISLALAMHITGMMQSTDCPIDGGTIVLSALFVLAVSPTKAFYSMKNGYSLKRPKSIDFHWPIALLYLFVGCFYTFAGIAKIVDVGPHWPFVLRLDMLAQFNLEREFFLTSRYSEGYTSLWHTSELLSIAGGFVTVIGEVLFITILTHPRRRLFLVSSMILLHVLVFLTTGINFLGSSIILLLCLDYNKLQTAATVYYDGQCNFCIKTLSRVKRLDWLNLVRLKTIEEIPAENNSFDRELLSQAMGLEEDNGEIYYGADAFEQVFLRVPLLMPIGIFMQIPGVIYLARYIYRLVAKNRTNLGCSLDGERACS